MTQFREGQDVEAAVSIGDAYDAPMSTAREWRKAKIVHRYGVNAEQWLVEFEGTTRRAVFDAANIRAPVHDPYREIGMDQPALRGKP